MMSFILSLVALVSLGTAWFFAARSSREMDPLSSSFAFQAVGIPFFLLFLPFINVQFNQDIILPIFLIGIFETFVMLALFYAMKIGDIGVVLPITDGYTIITVLLSFLFLNEIPTVFELTGVLLLMTGIFLVSTSINKTDIKGFLNLRKGVVPALLVAIGTGVYFFLVGSVAKGGAWFEIALGIRVSISLTALAIILLKSINLKKMSKGIVWKLILPGAFLDVVGFSFYNMAIAQAGVSYSTAMISAQSLISVLLGAIVIKEKVYRQQWIGIFISLFGLLLLQVRS